MNSCGNSKKSDVLSSLPPRRINVQKFSQARAAELESLHSIISDRLNKDFRSKRNKRRRTTSFNNQSARKRYRKRQRPESSQTVDHETKIPRRVRRRIELKSNPETGFCTSGDGTKRLRTHVWHAKRFTMTKLWGFHLPLGLHGRGKGSRAVLKHFRQGVLVHDASYYSAVQLEGPEGSISAILDMLMKPSPSSQSKEASDSILSGHTYGNVMIYQAGTSVLRPIAPVIYMWRPFHIPEGGNNEFHSRKCWVWIHASSFSEGYDSLNSACQKQMNETGVSVNCSSLEGQLAKLEILGSKSSQLLEKTLYRITTRLEESSVLKKCSADGTKVKDHIDLYNADCCSIMADLVTDPRITDNDKHEDVTKCLWDDAISEIIPPEDDSILCREKHRDRMDFLCLNDSKSDISNSSNRPSSSRSCPILLVKHVKSSDVLTGWSIILPLNWIKVFWNAFVSKGAHAIGQREKRWISCDVDLPFFPSDFPDCSSYSSSISMSKAAALEHKIQRRPPPKRTFKVPVMPPWNSIFVTLNKTGVRTRQMERSDPETSYVFDGIVARTSDVLSEFLESSSGEKLFMSPKVSNGDMKIMSCLKDQSEEKADHVDDDHHHHINHGYGYGSCLARVILKAYKEGSFEDGAVVCAPSIKDIMLWKDREQQEEDGLSIPQSEVSSYFQQQACGTWELNVPEDASSMESHRWPIGFVTKGFIRGSKKQRAEAYCDAALMGRLREEQWREVRVKGRKKEICVLVRNLRSSAYRLALASIVLEHRDYDVQCL